MQYWPGSPSAGCWEAQHCPLGHLQPHLQPHLQISPPLFPPPHPPTIHTLNPSHNLFPHPTHYWLSAACFGSPTAATGRQDNLSLPAFAAANSSGSSPKYPPPHPTPIHPTPVVSVILAYFVSSDGSSNWILGVQLIVTYVLIASVFLLAKEPRAAPASGGGGGHLMAAGRLLLTGQ